MPRGVDPGSSPRGGGLPRNGPNFNLRILQKKETNLRLLHTGLGGGGKPLAHQFILPMPREELCLQLSSFLRVLRLSVYWTAHCIYTCDTGSEPQGKAH